MYKEQIDKYFELHKDEMLNSICDIVKIDSCRQEPKEGMPFGEGTVKALENALKLAEDMGFKTTNYDNYVGAIDFSDKEKALDILAHLDVVPAGNGWTVTEPFNPIIKDGKLYGRGTCDNKGPAIVALYALKAVKDLNIPLSKNVRLLLGTDEECGSSDLKHYYSIEEEAPMSFTPDAEFPVINVEKGSLKGNFSAKFNEDKALPRIISVNSGVKVNVIPDTAIAKVEGLSLDQVKASCDAIAKATKVNFNLDNAGDIITITANGVGGHAAYPTGGNNALTSILKLLSEMDFVKSEGFDKLKGIAKLLPHGDYYGEAIGVKMSDEISGELTLSFTIFEYSLTSLKGTFDSRCPLCANNENLRDVVSKNLNEYGVELEPCEVQLGHHVNENSHFIQTLLNCYQMYTGNKGSCMSMGGATYVHDLKNGVAFGCSMPGVDNNMHSHDEFAIVEDLLTSAKIFTQAIIDLCK